MVYHGNGVMELQPDAYYNYPTYRYCRVCEIIHFLDFNQADRVRSHLGDAWQRMASRIKDNHRNYGFSEVSFSDAAPSSDYHEGPAESFPEFRAKLSWEVEVKAIATVCVPPNHSKLWVRVSSINGDSGSLFDDEQLGRFYSKASYVCERIADLLSEEYQSALDKEGLEDKLGFAHEIRIETTSSDLNEIKDFLQDDSMKMSSVLRDQRKYGSISGFIKRVYERDISMAELEEDTRVKWFKMRVSKPNRENLMGVYSKEHEEHATKFVGLVHNPSQTQGNRITQEFSRKLVQHIAPVI